MSMQWVENPSVILAGFNIKNINQKAERGLRMNQSKKVIISSLLTGILVLTSISSTNLLLENEKEVDAASADVAAVNTVKVGATITGELPAKRTKFVKQFAMSDGSYTAATYSMPVHYRKSGTWKEIDTTLVKSGKKKYKTKATDLSIKLSKKANKKSVVSKLDYSQDSGHILVKNFLRAEV